MLNAGDVLGLLYEKGIKFAAGVPDSLLSAFCAELANSCEITHITAANEGNAVALACGYNLATGGIPLIYMQNSGIGNAVNPLLSLADKNVYNIPALYIIGFRGEPSVKDEPQHITQGALTEPLLGTLGVKYEIISPDTELEEFSRLLTAAFEYMDDMGCAFAFLVRKGSFCAGSAEYSSQTPDTLPLTRRDAISAVLNALPESAVIVSTTGKTSRELYEIRNERGEGHEKDFLTVGSMGHASQLALAVSMFKKTATICCIDGEGAALMHMGAMAVNAALAGDNFVHVLINNGAHDSVGGQPNFGSGIDFSKIAAEFGYKQVYRVSEADGIVSALSSARIGAAFVQVDVRLGSFDNLSRPKETPVENKGLFTEYLRSFKG